MLHFAYDGSINGDWVSNYAIRLALAQPAPVLHVIHIRDSTLTDAERDERLAHLRGRCAAAGLPVQVEVMDPGESVVADVRHRVPTGTESFLVCGTRARFRGRGFLTGTVAERLLNSGHCQVLALRVVHPGLLGLPRRFLLPVAGAPWGLDSATPCLRLFAPDIETVDLLLVKEVRRARFRHLAHERGQRLLAEGRAYLREIERALHERFGLAPEHVQGHVVVSDDVPKEIVIAANRVRSRIILLGASRRKLTERLFLGNPLEEVLANAPCDVAIYGGPP